MILGPDGYIEVHPSLADRVVLRMPPRLDPASIVWSDDHEIPPPSLPDEYECRRYRVGLEPVRSIWLARGSALRRDNQGRQQLREWFVSLMRMGWNPDDTAAIVAELRRHDTIVRSLALLRKYTRQIEDRESQ